MKFFHKLDRVILFFVPVQFHKHLRVVRYLISGGTAAFVDLLFIYIFTSVIGIWYLYSGILAFLVAFSVSYVMQKFWTYTDHSMDRWKSQLVTYFMIIISTNVGLNTLLLYIFVDHLHINYIVAQFFISGIIAIMNYFLYQSFVFKKHSHE